MTFEDSESYRQIRLIAVIICVQWFKDYSSYIGIELLQKMVRDEIAKLKTRDEKALKEARFSGAKVKLLWPWDVPDELTTRRRINECQNKEFNAPQSPSLVCLGKRKFMGEDDSCYVPNLHMVGPEYHEHLKEFLPQGEQMTLA